MSVCQVCVPDQEADDNNQMTIAAWDHCVFVCQVCVPDQEDDDNQMPIAAWDHLTLCVCVPGVCT